MPEIARVAAGLVLPSCGQRGMIRSRPREWCKTWSQNPIFMSRRVLMTVQARVRSGNVVRSVRS